VVLDCFNRLVVLRELGPSVSTFGSGAVGGGDTLILQPLVEDRLLPFLLNKLLHNLLVNLLRPALFPHDLFNFWLELGGHFSEK